MTTQKTGKEIFNATIVALSLVVMVVISALIVATITSNSVFDDIASSGSVTNETGAWLNETSYTLTKASEDGFASPVITAIWGAEGGEYNVSIATANASVTSAGIVTNATVYTNDNVSLSYTYNYASGTSLAGLNATEISEDFGNFVTNLIAFLAIIGTVIGVVWLVFYVKRLFGKKEGIQGITA
jgi:cell division protein FtsL